MPDLVGKAPASDTEAGHPNISEDVTGVREPRRTRSASVLVGIAALSAVVTATAIGATSWHVDDGAWIGTSLLTLVALTATFLAGRAILAPSGGGSTPPSATAAPPEAAAGDPSPRRTTRSYPSRVLVSSEGKGAGPSSAPRPAPTRGAGETDVRGARAVDRDADRLRRHVRIRPRHRSVTVVTEQGTRYSAEIVDLSQSGVALEGTMPGVWIGSMVTVGSRRAKAVRMLPQGMALEFSVPIPAKTLHADTVL